MIPRSRPLYDRPPLLAPGMHAARAQHLGHCAYTFARVRDRAIGLRSLGLAAETDITGDPVLCSLPPSRSLSPGMVRPAIRLRPSSSRVPRHCEVAVRFLSGARPSIEARHANTLSGGFKPSAENPKQERSSRQDSRNSHPTQLTEGTSKSPVQRRSNPALGHSRMPGLTRLPAGGWGPSRRGLTADDRATPAKPRQMSRMSTEAREPSKRRPEPGGGNGTYRGPGHGKRTGPRSRSTTPDSGPQFSPASRSNKHRQGIQFACRPRPTVQQRDRSAVLHVPRARWRGEAHARRHSPDSHPRCSNTERSSRNSSNTPFETSAPDPLPSVDANRDLVGGGSVFANGVSVRSEGAFRGRCFPGKAGGANGAVMLLLAEKQVCRGLDAQCSRETSSWGRSQGGAPNRVRSR
jgi:hypothetical protein